MDKMIITNPSRTVSEILIDYDIGSFKIERARNSDKSISFTAFKTNYNADIFDLIQNESIILWRGQEYIIKVTDPKSDNILITNEVTAYHIMYEFQNHYIDKDLESEEMNSEEDDEQLPTPTYTLEQYLDFCFKGNKLGYKYKIVGNFKKRVAIDELGDKNGIEALVEGATLFGYTFVADNKLFYIYDEESYFTMSDVELIAGYNVDEANVSINTQEQKTYIKGFGKKRSKSETKNYSPVKPPQLKYNGTFFKEGTWRTQVVGASYEYNFNCKWGNENLTWSIKKLSRGGVFDVYIDNELIGRYSCYSHTARTESVVIARNLSKGQHTFKAVHRGADPNVKEYKTAPVMYVGTEKSTIFNLTAVLRGTDLYHVTDEYYSPYYDKNNPKVAPTIYDDNVLDKTELRQRLIEELKDEPVVELSTNYLDTEQIGERDMVYFKHKGLGFDTTLKVEKITEYHPLLNLPVEVEFSNNKKDIVKIQQEINNRIKNVDRQIKSGNLAGSSLSLPKLATEAFGSVLINE